MPRGRPALHRGGLLRGAARRADATGARSRYPRFSQDRNSGREVTLRSARVLLGPAGDIGMRREPDAGPRLSEADQLLDDPDARAVADDMRVHRQLEQAALVIGRLELAPEDVEHTLGRRIG